MNKALFFVMLTLFSASAYAQEEIWRCKDKNGHTYEAHEDVVSDTCKQIGGHKGYKKQKSGVYIGMTKDEAISSSWGKPKSINRTQTVYGIHEQWVYGPLCQASCCLKI